MMDNVVTKMRDFHLEVVNEIDTSRPQQDKVGGLTKLNDNGILKGCPLGKERTGLLVKPPQGALLSRRRC